MFLFPSGSKYWSPKERQQFRRAWRVHRKQFNMLQSSVETKSLPEIIEYYYSWKKYCPDEYRGRNRHVSEEVSRSTFIYIYLLILMICVKVFLLFIYFIYLFIYLFPPLVIIRGRRRIVLSLINWLTLV